MGFRCSPRSNSWAISRSERSSCRCLVLENRLRDEVDVDGIQLGSCILQRLRLCRKRGPRRVPSIVGPEGVLRGSDCHEEILKWQRWTMSESTIDRVKRRPRAATESKNRTHRHDSGTQMAAARRPREKMVLEEQNGFSSSTVSLDDWFIVLFCGKPCPAMVIFVVLLTVR